MPTELIILSYRTESDTFIYCYEITNLQDEADM